MDNLSVEERKNEYLAKLQSYVRTKPANGTDLADLAAQIKGDMTLTELGDLCGINKSSLSRLLNGKTQKNSTNEMIAGLAAVADSNPECSVNFENLVKANGMSLKENADEDQFNSLNENCRNAIVAALASSGVGVKQLSNNTQDSFDLLLKTDDQSGTWAMKMFFMMPTSKSAQSDLIVQQTMSKNLNCFFATLYLNGDEDYSKYSMVINNRKAYDWSIEKTEHKNIRDDVSIILMNPECTKKLNEKEISSRKKPV